MAKAFQASILARSGVVVSARVALEAELKPRKTMYTSRPAS